MTARREARRARLATAEPVLEGVNVPPELLDPAAAVWHNQRAYHRFMAQHGWTMPPAERMGDTTHPANRRQAAATGWGQDNGIRAPSHSGVDLHRLRAWGLWG